jgi:hypothetical protein
MVLPTSAVAVSASLLAEYQPVAADRATAAEQARLPGVAGRDCSIMVVMATPLDGIIGKAR